MADRVSMPKPGSFASREEYYSTLFHEMTHSTGHRSRLARDGVTNPTLFGSHAYSREELVAEMGAAFLAGHCGIETQTLDNSAAYLAGWLRVLRKDARMVVWAGGQAQRAADWITGRRQYDEQPAAQADETREAA